MKDKLLGGIYGALIGDACGCPYEFRPPSKIPSFDQIEMTPPEGYDRAWSAIPVGTYTDDGAQALILLNVLLSGVRDIEMQKLLRIKLIAWLGGGYMSIDNLTFDVGGQTRRALHTVCGSLEDVKELLSDDSQSGNGSLMRAIPAALVAFSLADAVKIGMDQSYVTHPSHNCVLCCGAYAGIAYGLLQDKDLDLAITDAFTEVTAQASINNIPNEKISYILGYEFNEPTGTGFVVDAFWSALWALNIGKTYEEVIKYAISLGNDTDTTACIAGGLAGIKFGFSGIPQKWLDQQRGTYLITPIVAELVRPYL